MSVTSGSDVVAPTRGRSRRAPTTTVAVTLLTAAIVGGLQVPGAGAAAAAPTDTTVAAETPVDTSRTDAAPPPAAEDWPPAEGWSAAEDPSAAEPPSGMVQAGVTPVGRLVPRAAKLKEISFERWGCASGHAAPCVSVIGGWRPKGSVPNSDHPKGKAIDVMVTTGGRDAVGPQQELGDDIATFMTGNATTLGVTYVIWDNRIWTRRSGWKTYCRITCPQGSVTPTYLHQDHVHVSVR